MFDPACRAEVVTKAGRRLKIGFVFLDTYPLSLAFLRKNWVRFHYCPVKDEVKMISVNIYGPINSFGDVSDLEFNL